MNPGSVSPQTASCPEASDGRGRPRQRGGVGIHDSLLAPRVAPHWHSGCGGAPSGPAALAASGCSGVPDAEPSRRRRRHHLHTQLSVVKQLGNAALIPAHVCVVLLIDAFV